jgi:3'-phosphoadenosine 5'-phosphosulfate (PAPS) 3'-phosphatase
VLPDKIKKKKAFTTGFDNRCSNKDSNMYQINTKQYKKEIKGAIALAYLSGSIMLHFYDLDYQFTEKENEAAPESAIFTEVDGKVDNIVQNYFQNIWPEDQLLTEETSPDTGWYQAKRIWIVDPIDGTMGYKKKTGYFGISIALIEEGLPVLGVLYAPKQNLLAWAVKQEGCFLNGKQIKLVDKMAVNTILCSSNSINRLPYQRALKLINQDNNLRIKTAESVVAKILFILNNEGEIYPILPISKEIKTVPKFWDIAAADIILREAGGKLTTFSGKTYRYNVPEFRCINGVLMGTKSGHELAFQRLRSFCWPMDNNEISGG